MSLASIKLDLFTKDGGRLGTASGFILEVSGQFYIITNWHIVSGCDFRTGEPFSLEDKPHLLRTLIHKGRLVGSQHVLPLQASWGIQKEFTLYDENGEPQWIEFKVYTQSRSPVDIVAMPLGATQDLDYPIPAEVIQSIKPKALYEPIVTSSPNEADDWRILAIPGSWITTDVSYGPSDAIQIVGYLRGLSSVGIRRPGQIFWKTGFIASENDTIELGKAMLVDALVDEGMSGAPVVGMKAGQPKLLGVYGGRYSPETSDFVGIVWSADVLKQLSG